MPPYTYVENLMNEVQIRSDETLSRTIYSDDFVKIRVFGFAAGQQLPQHTASVPAIMEIIKGSARVTLDGEIKEMGPGSLVHMEANLPHAIYAVTDVVMLLTMLTGAATK
jgi:quercetin dioxygenase-like cupin family protein